MRSAAAGTQCLNLLMPSRVPQCRPSHAVLFGGQGMLIPTSSAQCRSQILQLPEKAPTASGRGRPLQLCMHCCKAASHFLNLVEGVVVCADACVIDCGEPHHHRVPDAALRASYPKVRTDTVHRSQRPMASLHSRRAQVNREMLLCTEQIRQPC